MKVYTELQCGVKIGHAKFQDNIFVHYQYKEILYFSGFLTVHY